MAYNLAFATGDAQTAEIFEELFEIDRVADSMWDDLTYSLDAEDVRYAADSEMLEGVIKRHNSFRGGKKKGDTVTWYNGAALSGGPVLGDSTIINSTSPISTYTQTCSIDQARKSVSDNGRLSAQRVPIEFRTTARRLLSQWARVFLDETCNIALVGSNTFNNAYTCYTSNAFSVVMNTSLNATDTGNIIYAGNATTNATAAQQANQITAQLITRVVLAARQAPTTANFIPVKELNFKNSRSKYAWIADGNIERQLQYDDSWRTAVISGTPRSDSNRAITGSLGSFNEVEIIKQRRAFRPIANVSYSLLLGADALNWLPVHDWEWVEEKVDGGFKNIIIVAAMFGLTPTYFNSTKRNMKMIPHYVAV